MHAGRLWRSVIPYTSQPNWYAEYKVPAFIRPAFNIQYPEPNWIFDLDWGITSRAIFKPENLQCIYEAKASAGLYSFTARIGIRPAVSRVENFIDVEVYDNLGSILFVNTEYQWQAGNWFIGIEMNADSSKMVITPTGLFGAGFFGQLFKVNYHDEP
jgi:hypothetical protein